MTSGSGGPGGIGGPNRILDEFAKLMTDAAGVAQGVRKEAETAFRSQAERMINGLDIVKRDEFEAVSEMAANARDENDKLLKRIGELEKRIARLEGKGAGKTPVKSAAKPAAKKAAKPATATKSAKKPAAGSKK